jgi:hypothetical protein
MKRSIILAASLVFTFCLNAQINVGDKLMPRGPGASGDLEAEDLENLKKTTTVLVLPVKDAKRLEDYKKAVKQVWTFNTMEVITNADVAKYKKGNYSYITLGGLIIQRKDGSVGGVGGRTMATSTSNYFLHCWYPKPNKKGKLKAKTMARIELYMDAESNSKAIYMSNDDDDVESAIQSGDATFYNLNPGFVKLYLDVVNKHLKSGEPRSLFKDEKDDADMKKVAKDTLFIPAYVLNKHGIEDGKKITEAEIMEKYPYPYKYMSEEQLSAKILNAGKPIYVLSFVSVNGQKYFAIHEGKSGKLIFVLRTWPRR